MLPHEARQKQDGTCRFAVCIAGALAIALGGGDDGPVFAMHALLGLTACGLLVARLVLGVAGSRHNRLAGLFFTPAALLRYLRAAATGRRDHHAAHNPAAATAALGMFAVLVGLTLTGLPVSGEAGEEFHEVLAWVMLGLVATHLAGLLAHTMRHRENIGLAMVTGRKEGKSEDGLRSSRPLVAGVLLLGTVVWYGALLSGYSAASRTVTIPLVGVTIAVGDNDREGPEGSSAGRQEATERNDDDD